LRAWAACGDRRTPVGSKLEPVGSMAGPTRLVGS